MEDDEKNKNMEKDISRKPFSDVPNISTFFQPFWIRCHSVFVDITNREFVVRELRFVRNYGIVFWIIYLLSQIIK